MNTKKQKHHIHYTCDAAGIKLKKTAGSTTTDYVGNFIYEDNLLKYIITDYGKITVRINNYDTIFTRHYNLTDHLGNVRVTFSENGEILQEDSYYPFGLQMSGLSYSQLPDDEQNKYLFSGKELQEDFGYKNYDYGFRHYDPQLGRWHVPDPLAEAAYGWTPYRYAFNNPIKFIDPNGLWEFGVTKDDDGNKTIQLQKSDNSDDLALFMDESGMSKGQIKRKLFGGGKKGQASMDAFFGGDASSINISEFSGSTGEMLQGMESALNGGNAELAASGSDDMGDAINNCWNSTINLKTSGTVDSKPLEQINETTFFTSMLNGNNFDKALNNFFNVSNPQTGDAIRYSNDGGNSTTHGAIFLLNNKSGVQIFTKNGFANSAPFQISNQSQLPSSYGSPAGKKNYTVIDVVKGKEVKSTKSDSSPYYR